MYDGLLLVLTYQMNVRFRFRHHDILLVRAILYKDEIWRGEAVGRGINSFLNCKEVTTPILGNNCMKRIGQRFLGTATQHQ